MNFQLPNDGVVTDTPEFLDQFQRPCAAPAGTPSWTAGDSTIATLQPAADGLSAVITPVALGTYSYSFSDGGLSYSNSIDIVAPIATTVEPSLGAIAPKAA